MAKPTAQGLQTRAKVRASRLPYRGEKVTIPRLRSYRADQEFW